MKKNRVWITWQLNRLAVALPAAMLYAFTALNASAQLIAYEPFNYTSINNGTNSTAVGTPTQTSGGGFTGTWACSGTSQSITTGLTYTGLPVANSSLRVTGGSYRHETLATPQSSGTVYVSFLFYQDGDAGGNRGGVYLVNSSGNGFLFAYHQSGGSVGYPSIDNITNYATVGPELGRSTTLKTYAQNNFYVIKLTYTAGAVTKLDFFSNPTAGQTTEPTPDFTITSGLNLLGTLAAIGVHQNSQNYTIDEWRVGYTWADVAGYIPIPAAPASLTATPYVNAVGLSWPAVSGATGYLVLRGTNSLVYTVTNSVATNTNYDNTAVGGTTYYYVVEATNSSGISTNSPQASATPTIAPPNTPAGVTAVGTNGAVSLSWNLATGAASYNVKRATTSGGEATITNVTTTNYYDTAVVNGQIYYYKVSSTNSAGESTNSTEVSATPNLPPAAPTALGAVAGTNQVVLSWTGSAGATSYNVKRSTTSSAEVTIASVATTNYTDLTAVKFNQYYYVVSAVNADGESGNSGETNVTVLGSYGPVGYEPFNYPAGSLVDGTVTTASGFIGNWKCGAAGTILTGITYPSLPTAGYALQPNANYQIERLASPQSNGSVWVSVLFQQAVDNGGARSGFLMEDGTGTGLMFAYQQNGGTVGNPALQVMNSTNTRISQLSQYSSVPQTYTNNNFYVFELDYTAGVLSSVEVYSNPTADQNTVPSPDFSVTSGLPAMGPLSLLGGSGGNVTIDEIRVGQVWGDVVGYGLVSAPTIPTTLSMTVAQGENVSWTAQSTNYYQPQASVDNVTWTNVGNLLVGNTVSSVYQTAPEPYYRVLEFVTGPASPNLIANGSFEIPGPNSALATNWTGSVNDVFDSVWATNSYGGGAYLPQDGTNLLYMEGTTDPVTPTAPHTSLTSDLFPIAIAGAPYTVSYSIANPVKVGGSQVRCIVSWYATNNALISTTTTPLTGIGSAWTVETDTYTAPANAAKMNLTFPQGIGGGPSYDWVTLLDNVSVVGPTFAATNVLTPTLSLGAAFTATVISNGVTTAITASGTIAFLTNSVPLSTNIVAAGAGTSATTILTPPYTVTAIYSGDTAYIASTNTLTVSNAIAQVTLGSLSQTYDGTAKSATATTTPSGLTVHFMYAGSPNAPTNAGTYQVIGTVSDPLYVGSATNNLVIHQAAAVVSLGSLTQTYNGSARVATATTTPTNLTVNLTYNGSVQAPTNAGTYQVIGTVAAVNYYGSATNNLVVNQALAGVVLGSLNQTYDGTAKNATATTTPPGLLVILTYNGSTNAPTNAASYQVIGTVSDPNYYGSATNTFVINPGGGTSSDASLSYLALSPPGTLTPAFNPSLTNYAATNAIGTTSVTVTVTNTSAYATNTLFLNGLAQATNAGSLVGSVPVAVGSGNVIRVVVTAQDGVTTSTNTVTVTVLASTNVLLTGLFITPAGTLSPTFVSGTTNYTATNTFPATNVTVTATNADGTANLMVSFNGGSSYIPLTNEVASVTDTMSLGSPTNVFKVQVVSQDLSQTNVYTVNVLLQPSQTVPKLTNSVSGTTLTLTWPADHQGYRLLVQTNNLNKGVSSNTNDWGTVAGSQSITSTNITIIKTGVTNEYYRLVYP